MKLEITLEKLNEILWELEARKKDHHSRMVKCEWQAKSCLAKQLISQSQYWQTQRQQAKERLNNVQLLIDNLSHEIV